MPGKRCVAKPTVARWSQVGTDRKARQLNLLTIDLEDWYQLTGCVFQQPSSPRPDFLVVFNRLYDTKADVAFGGWELSDRNLAALERVRFPRSFAPARAAPDRT